VSRPASLAALRGPRAKLLLAIGLLLLLALLGSRGASSVVGLARGVLVLSLLGGVGWWIARGRSRRPAFQLEEPLQVLSRQGLSPRCSVALVQVDGQRVLVTYGEGFAQVVPLRPARRLRTRRPVSPRRAQLSGALQ
jgi:flagellar protein FliO/FliZ